MIPTILRGKSHFTHPRPASSSSMLQRAQDYVSENTTCHSYWNYCSSCCRMCPL